MAFALSLAFFASGASALIFETLWFHQAGLALGNSVWASSLVLAGFMGGLALGNALAARFGQRLAAPIRAYAWLEVAIALAGVGLVLLLPALGHFVAVTLRPLEETPWLLNACRLAIAFALLLVPSTAMGVTLPLLTRALTATGAPFGRALGGLYGWNTLGAVAGTLAADVWLIGAVGILGTALLAGAGNLAAAAVAGCLALRYERPGAAEAVPTEPRRFLAIRPEARPWLLAAFASGFVLLALEVVWFRFLALYVTDRATSFASMLATVLAGISLGGFAGARWLSWKPTAHRHVAGVAFVAGACCVASFAAMPRVLAHLGLSLADGIVEIVRVGTPLMFPVSFLSGVFFTLVGAALRHEAPDDTSAVGSLTLFNTVGAALGSLCAGFVLLPGIGMENALYLAALLYGAIGGWTLFYAGGSRRVPILGTACAFALAVAFFPFGSIESHHLPFIAKRWMRSPEDRIVRVHESAAQTLVYVEQRTAGEVHSHRLLTNAMSMAGSHGSSRRYSKLYVYLPVAIHPDPKNALVISFGLGSTAKAVTDTAAFEHIDVVDISKAILELSDIVYPESEHPLRDPRVEVHVEDGRYFLQATDRRFDLITGEPPPPNAAGVVNLYTREYFALAHDRLDEGGMVTYWLPIHSMPENGALAVIRSFCDVFDDCTLWNGIGRDLMLVGSRGATQRVTAEHFRRQWDDPDVRDELVALGFERPEQLGALFIAGADYLNELTRDVLPLVDDFPKRLVGPDPDLNDLEPLYRTWTDTARARERFLEDPFVASLWPPSVREASLPYFDAQQIINDHAFGLRPDDESLARDTIEILTETDLVAPALWMMGTNADLLRIAYDAEAKGRDVPNLKFYLGAEQLAKRRYEESLALLESAERNPHNFTLATSLRILALCAAGHPEEAHALAIERRPRMVRSPRVDDFFEAAASFCNRNAVALAYTPD